MKLSLFGVALFYCAFGLNACAPSPYYTGTKGGLAPGAVPRDGRGRPVLDGKAIEYVLPPTAAPIGTDIAGRPTLSPANRIIYYGDLRYADPSAPAPNEQTLTP